VLRYLIFQAIGFFFDGRSGLCMSFFEGARDIQALQTVFPSGLVHGKVEMSNIRPIEELRFGQVFKRDGTNPKELMQLFGVSVRGKVPSIVIQGGLKEKSGSWQVGEEIILRIAGEGVFYRVYALAADEVHLKARGWVDHKLSVATGEGLDAVGRPIKAFCIDWE